MKKFLNKIGLLEDDALPVPAKAKAAPLALVPKSQPTVDPEFQKAIAQSLQDNKLSGFDYLKFSLSVEETEGFGASEETRFKMTFSTAKQFGVNKANLLKSSQHYLDILTQNEADFESDCDSYEKKEIKSRETKLSQTETTMASLEKQLTQLREDQATLTQELQDENDQLETRKSAFQLTLASFRDSIVANV